MEKSKNMNWYEGTLLYKLENVHISSDYNQIDCRFPVQTVIRPHTKEFQDYRGFAGRIDGGIFKVGDKIKTLPSGFTSKIKTITSFNKDLDEAFTPMSVSIVLDDDIDVSRGDMIVRENNIPIISQDIEILVTWFNQVPLTNRKKVIVRHTTNECVAIVKDIKYKIDINTLHRIENIDCIEINDIARISIRTSKPLFFDSYKKNRKTGSMILIDEQTNETLGAGIITNKI